MTYNWRSCFLSSRELHSLIKSHNCLKGPSHVHLEGGISFGIGAFNLVGHKIISKHHLLTACRVCNHVFVPYSLSGRLYLQTLSLFPPRILKVLEFAGFSGDKVWYVHFLPHAFIHELTPWWVFAPCVVLFQEYGLSLLHDGATGLNLRSMLCALLLLCYYTFLTFILGSAAPHPRITCIQIQTIVIVWWPVTGSQED